jgi:phenylpropionate dioxygenase-like ring-hydroxylating dioxygenase large terminal subunit
MESEAMFLRNSWYVVAWTHELGEKPIGIRVLDESIVIFRDGDGRPAVLEDRCAHRHFPLSLGCPVASGIQCGYHGMVFDRSGKCVSVPSQSAIPPRAQVRSYPTEERYGWIWAWMGEPDLADADLIPDFSMLASASFRAVGKTTHVLANYQLVTDNLMDLSHVGYVHQSTIGNPEMTANGKLSSRRVANGVEVLRLVPDVPPPPTYIKTGVLPEGKNIDRWQVINFVAPCFLMIHVGGKEAGKGALEGDYTDGLNLWIMNAITPETANTTHYFWASVRAHDLESEIADALFFNQVGEAFAEDKRVLEAQQRVLDSRPDSWDLALRSDAGSIESRRVLQDLIDREQAAMADAA